MHSKKKLLILFSTLAFSPYVLSADYQVVSGSASSSTSESKTTIENSPHAILHWDDFSIAENNHLHFAQINAASTVLNRVTGNNLSALMGTLTSNGQVYLINPNGILVGPNALIQTAGFLASTADLSNDQFLAGKELLLSLPGNGKIVNQGSIQCAYGNIYLIAKDVSNDGTCSSDFIGIGSAVEVLIQPQGSQRLYIRPDPVNVGEVVNTGTLEALALELRSSSAYEKAIRIEGPNAQLSATIEGGRIILSAEAGGVEVDGAIAAPSGEVQVLGKEIHLGTHTNIDTSGQSGGTVYIGGGPRGQDPHLFNADTVSAEDGARIFADGLTGDGGQVIVWSNGITDFNGHINARALGPLGNGGFAEVSALMGLRVNDHPDLSAYAGKAGTLLLDPGSVLIQDGPNTAPPGSLDVFNDGWINDQLLTTSLTIDTANSTNAAAETMTVNGDVVITWATANDLTLIAGRDVVINSGASITSTSTGDLTIQANTAATSTGNFIGINITGATISTANGILTLTGNGGDTGNGNVGINISSGALIKTFASGALNMTGTNGSVGPVFGVSSNVGIQINGSTVTVLDGTMTLTGTGGSDNTPLSSGNDGIFTTATIISSTGSGAILLTGNAGNGDLSNAGIYLNTSTLSNTTGPITLTGFAFGTLNSNIGTNLNTSAINVANGPLTIMGTGGTGTTYNWGVGLFATSTITSTGTGTITITGIGGAAADTNYGIWVDGIGTVVTSDTAAITLTGTSNATGGSNDGVHIFDFASVTSTGTGLTAASIAITGTSGTGINNNNGVSLNQGTITAVDGTISIKGTGQGTGSNNTGIQIANTSQVQSSGASPNQVMMCGPAMTSATICLDGQGSIDTGATSANFGIYLTDSSTAVTSVSGPVSLQGTGGGDPVQLGASNYGVYLSSSSLVESTGFVAMLTPASISIIGQGGSGFNSNNGIQMNAAAKVTAQDGTILLNGTGHGTGNDNDGIAVASGAQILSQGPTPGSLTCNMAMSTICLIGQGSTSGTAGSNYGITIAGTNTLIQTGVGNVKLDGTGGGTSDSNIGLQIIDSTVIQSTGAGSLTLIGHASATGTSSNYGIFISADGTTITSATAPIVIDGTGRGSGENNFGIRFASNCLIESSVSAPITITGQGANGTDQNYGIRLDHSPSITTVDGTVTITGTGGNGSTNENSGIRIDNIATISSSGDGQINLIGIAGTGVTGNSGISITDPGSLITSISSPIFLNGTGHGSGGSNVGISLASGAVIQSTGSSPTTDMCGLELSTICLMGQGSTDVGATSNNYGIYITGMGSTVSSVSGPISLQGTGGDGTDTNIGVFFLDNALLTTENGSVSINGTGSGTGTGGWGVLISGTSQILSSGATPLTVSCGMGSSTICIIGQGSLLGGDISVGVGIDESALVSSVAGDISIQGTGGGDPSSIGLTRNFGVGITNHGLVTSTGAFSMMLTPANISIIGQGGSAGTSGGGTNHGIYLGTLSDVPINSTISAVDGTISLNGTGGGTGDGSLGIFLTDTSQILSTGTSPATLSCAMDSSTICLIGQGSVSGSNLNLGVGIGDSSLVSSVSGNISIHGTGGGDPASMGLSQNFGVGITNQGFVTSTGAVAMSQTPANISILGTGGSGGTTGGSLNHGIYLGTLNDVPINSTVSAVDGAILLNGSALSSGSSCIGIFATDQSIIQSTGPSPTTISCGMGVNTICLIGQGSSAGTSNNAGIDIEGASLITSSVGSMSLTGTGGGNGTSSNNFGIHVFGAAQITSTISAPISLTGTAGSGTTTNHGIYILGPTTAVSTVDGQITFNGTGNGSSFLNHGIYLQTSALVQSTGTGPISMTGLANTGLSSCVGTFVDTTCSVTVVDGNMTLVGTALTTSDGNQGTLIAGTLSSTGIGIIDITGTASVNGASSNFGITLSGATISSITGAINLLGTGLGSATNNHGIFDTNASLINSTGTAPITLTGIGGSGGWGIQIIAASTTVSSVTGAISLLGTAGSNNRGIQVTLGARVTGSGAAPFILQTLNSGDISIDNDAQVTTLGTLSVTCTRDLKLIGGSSANQAALLQHGSGNATFSITRDLLLTVGSGSATFANIGTAGGAAGLLFTSIGRNLSLTGSTGTNNYAQIGSTATSASGNITFTTIGGFTNLNITSSNAYTAIGHGLPGNAASTLSGDISLTSAGNINVNGATVGVGTVGFAQIGHVNQTASGSSLSGSITLHSTTGILNVLGGTTSANAYARVGLGGQSGVTTFGVSNLLLTAGLNCNFTSSPGAGQSTIISPGSGNITILGSGSGSDTYSGILADQALISCTSGNISMTGTGGDTGSNNNGIYITNVATVTTAAGAGQISMTGTGGPGTSANHGILVDTTSLVTTNTGSLALTGTGGNSDGLQINAATVTTVDGPLSFSGTATGVLTDNRGIALLNGAVVSSTGIASTGTIGMTGIGSTNGTTGNHGILVSDATTSVTSVTGNITLTGTGHGSGINNRGVTIENAATVTSTGTASVTLAGTGGTTATNSWGILLTDASTLVSSTGGAITLHGTGGGSTSQGTRITSGAQVTSSGSSTVTLATFNASDLSVDTDAVVITTASAPITINSSRDVLITGGSNMNEAARIDCDAVGVLSITASRDLILTGGSNTSTSAQIQNNAPGDAFFTIGRDLTLTGGTGSGAEAGIHPTGPTSSLLFGTIGRDLILTSGSGLNAIAHIGSFQTIEDGRILFGMIDGNVTLTATDTNSFAAIGHGLPSNGMSTLSGYIHFPFIMGDVTLQGANAGAGTQGFAQIGHIDQIGLSSTVTGDITINNLGSISVNGGTAATSARAQIGPGGQSMTTTFGAATQLLTAGVNCSLQGVMGFGEAIIINPAGDLTIVVDNLFPTAPSIGPGAFNFGSMLIATGNLKIYTATQSQNNVPTGSVINGQMYSPGPEFVDSPTEEWNTYYPGGTYGGASFKFYYKNNNIIPPPPPPPGPPGPPNPSQLSIANEGSLADLIAAFLVQQIDRYKCECVPDEDPNSCLKQRGCFDYRRQEYD